MRAYASNWLKTCLKMGVKNGLLKSGKNAKSAVFAVQVISK